MSKCAAKIQLGWITRCFEADDPCGIIGEASKIQDLYSLLIMGGEYEKEQNKEELAKLRAFLSKFHDHTLTMEDIKGLHIRLSTGVIACLGVAETEEEIDALRSN